MAEPVSTELYKVVKFEFKYKIFNETGDLMPASSEFVTADKNEFQYLWQINYSFTTIWKTDLQLDYPEYYEDMGNAAASVVWARPETTSYGDDDDDDDDDEDDDSSQQAAQVVIHKIEVSAQDKLIGGDSAYVTILINNSVCFDEEFGPESPLSVEREVNPRMAINSSCSDPCIHVNIKVDHRCDKFSNELVEDLSAFFDNETLRDVTFVVGSGGAGDREISAHRQILSARNSVFRSMFESDMLERQNGKVRISDIEPDIFTLLLRFLYSGKVDADDHEDLLKLVVAADKYSIASLVKICEKLITTRLTANKVIDVFAIADLVKLAGLKETCIEFIHKNKCQVINSEGYKNLVRSNRADLISEILCYNLDK